MDQDNTNCISSQQMIQCCDDLQKLVAAGNSKSISKLLKKFPIAKTDYEGNTVLHYVSEVNSNKMIKYLIEAGSDVNAKNRRHETPLIKAILKNNDKTAKTLISSGASVNHKYYRGYTGPLHKAADKGNVKLIKVLLDAGCIVDAKNKMGNTPLLIAVKSCNIKVAKTLLDAGATRNHKFYWSDEGPLHKACKSGHLEMVKLLINAGFEVTAYTTSGYTPLYSTINSNHRSNEDGKVLKIMKVLIKAGADVNAKTANNFITPLHQAACFGFKDEVDLLLNSGAALEAIDNGKNTPLFRVIDMYYSQKLTNYSIRNENKIIIARRFIEAGANINKVNFYGDTCVHLAATWASVDLLTLFIKCGAKIDVLNRNNMDPLCCALYSWSEEEIRTYLKNQAQTQSFDYDAMIEKTLETTNVIKDQIKCIEILCKHGIKINQIADATYSYLIKLHSKIIYALLRQGMIIDFENSEILAILANTNFGFKKLQSILIRHAAICNFYENSEGIARFNLDKLSVDQVKWYEDGIKELKNLSSFLIYESMPLSNLIRGPISSRYILNDLLIKSFETGHIAESFPIFKDILTDRFEIEREKYELISKATAGLQILIKFNKNSFALIYSKILGYLETKDLHTIASLTDTESPEASNKS